MKVHFITLLLLVLGCNPFFGQHRNIMISDQNKPNETSIAMDFKNPEHLLVGANINNYYTSNDGGLNWEMHIQKSSLGVWGDPVMVIDTAGNYYHFHLSRPEKNGHWIDRIVCQKSTDRGETFNDGTYMGLNGEKEQDKHWVAVDRSNNNLYVTWTQFDEYGSKDPDKFSNILFSKSTDQGESWSEALQINSVSGDCIDDDNTVEGAVPAVGPNGEIYVAWAGPNGLVFNKSMDEGETWLENEVQIDSMPHGWSLDIPGIYRSNGMPITVCDLSGGENHGVIYVAWADQRNGFDNADVWLSKSNDQGSSWTAPSRVNQDNTSTQQFFPWMTVDQTNGNLFFVYHDRRNHPATDSTDVFMTYSTDGGETFADIEISESSFLPNKNEFFGDYNNIVAHNNIVRPVWTRLDDKKISVWTAIVDADDILYKQNRELEVNYKPDLQTIYLNFGIQTTVDISLQKLDGEIINQWPKHQIKGTRNALLLKNPLKKGIYYLNVRKGGKDYRKQIIVD
jgi:hypothetical protein